MNNSLEVQYQEKLEQLGKELNRLRDIEKQHKIYAKECERLTNFCNTLLVERAEMADQLLQLQTEATNLINKYNELKRAMI